MDGTKLYHLMRFSIENWGPVGGFLLGLGLGSALHIEWILAGLLTGLLAVGGYALQERVKGWG